MPAPTRPLGPGDRAPAFALPVINGEGTVSLEDFRGRRGVLLAFFRGLHCPFCRRQVVQLGAAQPALAAVGVDTLAVVNTPLERARLYFRHHPVPVVLLSDPECRTHAAFGVPKVEFAEPGSGAPPAWPHRASLAAFQAARINPTGELAEPLQPLAANDALNRLDGFALAPADEAIFAAHGTQLTGHFLIDRAGIVRWARTEAPDDPADLCRFPSPAELVAASRLLGTA